MSKNKVICNISNGKYLSLYFLRDKIPELGLIINFLFFNVNYYI